MHDRDTFHDHTVLRVESTVPTAALVVTLPDDPVQQDSWRRGVARLGAVRDAHVVAVVRTRVVGRDLQVDHDLPAGSQPARTWITSDSMLSPGQIVTLGAALARGLAALHREGICRAGQLTLDDVVIDRDGRPRWRVAYAVPQGHSEMADDVASLAAILRELLAERTAPGPLTLALLRAEDEDPRRRPTAGDFADSLIASTAAEPLTTPVAQPNTPSPVSNEVLPQPDGVTRRVNPPSPVRSGRRPSSEQPERGRRSDVHRESTRRRPPWRLVAITVITVVAGIGVLRGAAVATQNADAVPMATGTAGAVPIPTPPPVTITTSPSMSPTPSSVPTTDPSNDVVEVGDTAEEAWGPAPMASPAGGGRSPDLPWAAVVAALDAARALAFSRGDAGALARANAAGSPAMEADLATLSGLRAAGLLARGFTLDVVSVAEVSSDASSVLLRVVDRRAAYSLVTPTGIVRERRPARPASTWLVTLTRVGSPVAWRIKEVKAG